MRLLVLFVCVVFAAGVHAEVQWEPITFKAADGTTVEAERGEITVPLRHEQPGGATTTLAFVRFAATTPTPGHPIVWATSPGAPV